MISIEMLRRYPHFSGISEECLKEVALLCEERQYHSGEAIFEESGSFLAAARIYEKGKQATHLMLLIKGEVDVFFTMGGGKKVVVGNLVAGDLMAISALIPPYHLTASGVAKKDCGVIQIEAQRLRELCEKNPELGYRLLQGVAQSLRDRLQNTRVELAGEMG